MTALSVSPAYPIFTDRAGQPLENGYIWIGAANQPPQTNPIAVFWDAALTQPAAQPVRTINGYPSNSGTPGRLYVGSDYSLMVQDAKGSVVYSAPDSTERLGDIGSEDVLFVQAGAGAVTRTVQGKLRDVVSVRDFGAMGDGVADDTAAIQAAINLFSIPAGTPTAGTCGGTIYFPRGVYRVSGLAISNNASTNNGYVNGIKLIGDHAVLRGTAACTKILAIQTSGPTINIGAIRVEGLQFDLTAMTTPGITTCGLYVRNATNCDFKNLAFFGGPVDNTHVYLDESGSLCKFQNIYGSRIRVDGLDFGPAQYVWTTTHFINVSCVQFYVSEAWGLNFIGCTMQNPVGAAFTFANCRHIWIEGCDAEGGSGAFLNCSTPGAQGISYLTTEGNSWSSLSGGFITGSATNSVFRDRYSVGSNAGVGTVQGGLRVTVGTSATEIFNFSGDPTITGSSYTYARLTVFGDNGSSGFVDDVAVAFGGVIRVISSNTAYGTPPARTYTFSGVSLSLALASGSLQVKAVVLSSPFL